MFAPHDDSPEYLCRLVASRLRAALPECKLAPVEGDPFFLEVVKSDDRALRLHLGALVSDMQSAMSPEARQALVDSYVSVARESLYPPVWTLGDVYLALRNKSYFEQFGAAWFDDPLVTPGPGDLVGVVVADMGQGLKTVTSTLAIEAGFTPRDVQAAAEANVLALMGEIGTAERAPGVVVMGFDGYPWLGSTLLSVPKALELVIEDRGWVRALVSATTRGTVDMVDADAPGAVLTMQHWMYRQLAQDSRPQSEVVFTMTRGHDLPIKTHRFDDAGQLIALV